MKKFFKVIFILIISINTAFATHTTEKTFFLPRSHGVNLPMEYTAWNEFLSQNTEEQFGTNFQVVPFYQESLNGTDLGKYFGVKNKISFNLHSGQEGDVRGTYIIHDATTAAGNVNLATIEIYPHQKATGIRFDYFQNLERVMENLYLKVAIPIIFLKNTMNLKIKEGTAKDTFLDYFKGKIDIDFDSAGIISGQAHNSAQESLTHAKIPHDYDYTAVDVADIDIIFGYNVLNNNRYKASINLGFSFPTGEEPSGFYVFESIVGGGNHWSLNAGINSNATMWKHKSKNLKLNFALNYKYLFQSTEKRTLKLKGLPYSQYYLIGKIGNIRNQTKFIPAANILTRNINVTPGSQIDTILGFSYNHSGLIIDVGYNFFWKNKESVSSKDHWFDGKYGILHPEQILEGNKSFELSDNPVAAGVDGGAEKLIYEQDLDIQAASTPSLVTHKIYGSLGYLCLKLKRPIMLGFGCSYEFAEKYALENWQIWTKMGITF